jgi:DNA-binding PadR family transcriptional regulator
MERGWRSALGLAVLGILAEEPMHAYRIQQVIQQRGKDRVVNVRQRARIYQAIERLLALDLISVRSTTRAHNRPERTVYELTAQGRETARVWVREMLLTTGNEFPDFPVGVSFLSLLTPQDARQQLETRFDAITAELADIDRALRESGELPRLFLLEEEYRRAVLTAERAWVGSLVEDLRTGRMAWSEQWLRAVAAAFNEAQKDQETQDEQER